MKKLPLSFYSILIATILNPLVSQAQFVEEEDLLSLYDDEELISIATGTDKPIRFAPSVATVITTEDIKNTGARFLDDVLEMVPGLHVARGSNRQNAIYSMRGIHTAENPQVLLLIDGVDSAQLFNSSRPYNFRLPVASIKRIEVIRGPGSAVYGADAFSGVINVITKSPSKDGDNVIGGRTGSFDSQDLWLAYGAKAGSINFDFSMDYSRSDGDNDRIIESDSATGTSFAPGPLEAEYELFNSRFAVSSENWKFSLHSWNLINAGLGSGGAEALDPIGHDETDALTAQYHHTLLKTQNGWKIDLNLYAKLLDQNADFLLFPQGTNFLGNVFPDGVIGRPSTKDRIYNGEWITYFDGLDDHSFRFSVGYEYQKIEAAEVKNFDFAGNILPGVLTDVTGTNEIFLQDQRRELYFVSLQDEWEFANDWALTLGVRFDEYNDFGGTVNPRIALVWAAGYNVTLKALYGRAFRAPSFAELFVENNPSLLGNPNLEPEVIDTLEVAVQYDVTQNFNTKLNVFYYEIDDLIDFPALFVPAQNRFSQYGHGLEWEANWSITDIFSIKGNLAWQDSQQQGAAVADAPKYQAYVLVNVELPRKWSISTVGNLVLGRERRIGDVRSDVGNYFSADLVVRKANLVSSLDMAVVATNLFDADIDEPSDGMIPSDYPLDGRSLRLELTYNLN